MGAPPTVHLMTPEQYGEIQRTLGRIEGSVSVVNSRLDGMSKKFEDGAAIMSGHAKRIETVERRQWYSAGAAATLIFLFKTLWK